MALSWVDIGFVLILILGFVLTRWYRVRRREAARAKRENLALAQQMTESATVESLLQPGEQIEYEKRLKTGGAFVLTNLRTIQIDDDGEVRAVPLRDLRKISVHATGSWPNQTWFVSGTTPAGSVDIVRTRDRQACDEIALHIQTALLRASTRAGA